MSEDTDTINTIPETVPTPSLNIIDSEPVPAEIVRDLLRDQWRDATVAKPEIHVLDDVTFPEQGNLAKSDWIIIQTTSNEEEQRGFTYEFKDIETNVSIDIHTVKSRQNLYNVMSEVRRIIYKNHETLKPYQMVYWDGFDEDSEGMHKYWKGTCNIRLTSAGVPVFKGVVTGMGSPNLPENQR